MTHWRTLRDGHIEAKMDTSYHASDDALVSMGESQARPCPAAHACLASHMMCLGLTEDYSGTSVMLLAAKLDGTRSAPQGRSKLLGMSPETCLMSWALNPAWGAEASKQATVISATHSHQHKLTARRCLDTQPNPVRPDTQLPAPLRSARRSAQSHLTPQSRTSCPRLWCMRCQPRITPAGSHGPQRSLALCALQRTALCDANA
jgi:hypothetical protein